MLTQKERQTAFQVDKILLNVQEKQLEGDTFDDQELQDLEGQLLNLTKIIRDK